MGQPDRKSRGDADKEEHVGEPTGAQDLGALKLPGLPSLFEVFGVGPHARQQVRIRVLSLLQSVRPQAQSGQNALGVVSEGARQEYVDLRCAGETEDAWLFHGHEGSPVEHLSIPKDQVPERVEWIRVMLDIYPEAEEGEEQG